MLGAGFAGGGMDIAQNATMFPGVDAQRRETLDERAARWLLSGQSMSDFIMRTEIPVLARGKKQTDTVAWDISEVAGDSFVVVQRGAAATMAELAASERLRPGGAASAANGFNVVPLIVAGHGYEFVATFPSLMASVDSLDAGDVISVEQFTWMQNAFVYAARPGCNPDEQLACMLRTEGPSPFATDMTWSCV